MPRPSRMKALRPDEASFPLDSQPEAQGKRCPTSPESKRSPDWGKGCCEMRGLGLTQGRGEPPTGPYAGCDAGRIQATPTATLAPRAQLASSPRASLLFRRPRVSLLPCCPRDRQCWSPAPGNRTSPWVFPCRSGHLLGSLQPSSPRVKPPPDPGCTGHL